MDAQKIKTALAAVHYHEKRDMTRVEAFRYYADYCGLNDAEREVLRNALHIRAEEARGQCV